MAGKKKFGAFAGVFTPSLLTILGVIMYMRMGWVVGNAGLIGTLAIILIAHVISISTGLSISSISTDKKVGAGGIYYILSRSLGIPIGGAIGLALYIGTAFSISLYLIGFAESFNGYFGFDTGINGLRLTGAIALIALTVIALISTSVALKTQFLILAAIIISLGSIFLGTHDYAPKGILAFADGNSIPLEIVFAIFFPAVTGFTAGIAMSGDLKNPKRDIPIGTIASISVGFIVYIALAIFLATSVDSEILKSDYNILMKIALFAPAVVAGIWGATLSSALGGVLGGPRILQAMSLDKITPRVFGKGKGKNNEPVNALLLVFVIAFSGILIGELDIIARVVSMFYLVAYGVINLSFFLESWANPDFQPTFKVKRWIGLIGFVASFAVMFKLDIIAMLGSIIIILGIYFWLQRKQIGLKSGDVWQSVWANIVAKGLKKLDAKDPDVTNWNPNIILFSGESPHRKYLVELSNTLSGQTGIVTNFKLILDKDNKPLSRANQIVKDQDFKKLGVFARQVRVDNIFRGIENIASTFGFSGVEPNTIMMGWPRLLNHSADYGKMTEKLLYLDYNLLYLDFDQKKKFGNYQTVDLWWRETDSKNAEMMLNIARFILQSPQWNNVGIRVLFVNHNNIDNQIIKSKISKLVKDLRVKVEIKVINNGVEQKPFYDIIALQSANTDLTLIGIPNIRIEKQAEFIVNTNHLFETIGSTLMVKASDNFNELELDLSQELIISEDNVSELVSLPETSSSVINKHVQDFDAFLLASLSEFSQPTLTTIASFYSQFIEEIANEFSTAFSRLLNMDEISEALTIVQSFTKDLVRASESFRENKLFAVSEALDKRINTFINSREEYINKLPNSLKLDNGEKIKWRRILKYYFTSKIVPTGQKTLFEFGAKSYVLLNALTEGITSQSYLFIETLNSGKENALDLFNDNVSQLLQDQQTIANNLKATSFELIQNFERSICIDILENYDKPNFFADLKKEFESVNKKDLLESKKNTLNFPKYWLRNQILSHKQAEIGWTLLHTGLGLVGVNSAIKNHLNESLFNAQHKKIELLKRAAKALNNEKNKRLELEMINSILDLSEGVSNANLSNLLEEEEKKSMSISQRAPNMVELMSPESFNELLIHQGESVETIQVNLSDIQSHIVQSDYLTPLQEILQHLELSYNQNSEEIYNLANHISELIYELEKDNSNTEHKALIEVAQEDISKVLQELNTISESFFLDLNTHLSQTQDSLDIRTIIDSAELLSRAAQKPIIKSRLQERLAKNAKVFKSYRTKVIDFVNNRKHEIDKLKFDDLHKAFSNRIEQTRYFIDSIAIDSKASKELPFYYKKLFTGSHLSGGINKENLEMRKALRAINSIRSGASGAIMIVGDSLSGKTHFSENVAKSLIDFEKFDINPPENQSYGLKDLDLAFQKIFGRKGTSLAILSKLKKSRVFVFNDLERWWTRSANGSEVLDYLAELIEKVGDKHYFILNCNKYAFQIIKQTTQLEAKLLSTIVVPPVNTQELHGIILKRHKIGGADVYYNGDLAHRANKITKVTNRIYGHSNGNVGIALNLWLANIGMSSVGELFIQIPSIRSFPNIKDPEWKLVLYHFILHRKLSEEQLKEIMDDSFDWERNTLREMQKAGLVFKKPDGKYELNSMARYYIENWLKTLSFIN